MTNLYLPNGMHNTQVSSRIDYKGMIRGVAFEEHLRRFTDYSTLLIQNNELFWSSVRFDLEEYKPATHKPGDPRIAALLVSGYASPLIESPVAHQATHALVKANDNWSDLHPATVTGARGWTVGEDYEDAGWCVIPWRNDYGDPLYNNIGVKSGGRRLRTGGMATIGSINPGTPNWILLKVATAANQSWLWNTDFQTHLDLALNPPGWLASEPFSPHSMQYWLNYENWLTWVCPECHAFERFTPLPTKDHPCAVAPGCCNWQSRFDVSNVSDKTIRQLLAKTYEEKT